MARVLIRHGNKPGDFSALNLDSLGGANPIFLARTYFVANKGERGGDYSIVLQDASLPGKRRFKAIGRPILDDAVAEEASHYLIRRWADAQGVTVKDDTVFADVEYNVPRGEIDFS